jgi:hypothetical protein
VPIGLLGIITALFYIKNYKIEPLRRFDMTGFLLFGISLAGIFFAFESIGSPLIPTYVIVLISLCASLGFFLFYRHYKKTRNHVLNLKLFSIRTFSIAALGNLWIRLGISSVLFLLPLFFQMGYGLSPLDSGLLTCVGAIGMILSKSINKLILRRLDFRKMLSLTSILTGMIIMSFSLISKIDVPLLVSLIFVYGLIISLQYTGMNVLYYVDLNQAEMSSATSISSTLQQLSMGIGITVSTLVLQCFIGWGRTLALNNPVPFRWAFLVMGAIAALSVLIFSKLKPTDGLAVR